MQYKPEIHHRRSIRLQGYDYAQAGAYFVTICTLDRECLFGRVVDGQMRLSEAGEVVAGEWINTADVRDEVALDEWVVMPNHFHGILVIADGRGAAVGRGMARRAPMAERFGRPVSGSVPTIIRSCKSAVTRRVNELRQTPGAGLWQRNYWEHVIRDEAECDRIRAYIRDNPARWEGDRLYTSPGGPADRPPCPDAAREPSAAYETEEWMV